jgi:hypothetical protein
MSKRPNKQQYQQPQQPSGLMMGMQQPPASMMSMHQQPSPMMGMQPSGSMPSMMMPNHMMGMPMMSNHMMGGMMMPHGSAAAPLWQQQHLAQQWPQQLPAEMAGEGDEFAGLFSDDEDDKTEGAPTPKKKRLLVKRSSNESVLSRSYVTIGGDERTSMAGSKPLPVELRKRGLEWICEKWTAPRTYAWSQKQVTGKDNPSTQNDPLENIMKTLS